MICFPGLLVRYATDAGIKVPEEPDKTWDIRTFAHFHLLCVITLDRPGFQLGDTCVHNAKIIATLSKKEVQKLSVAELREKGCVID